MYLSPSHKFQIGLKTGPPMCHTPTNINKNVIVYSGNELGELEKLVVFRTEPRGIGL